MWRSGAIGDGRICNLEELCSNDLLAKSNGKEIGNASIVGVIVFETGPRSSKCLEVYTKIWFNLTIGLLYKFLASSNGAELEALPTFIHQIIELHK